MDHVPLAALLKGGMVRRFWDWLMMEKYNVNGGLRQRIFPYSHYVEYRD